MSTFSVRAGATEILLIRHADAWHDGSLADLALTHGDLPLTERGRRQAALLALRLSTRGIGAVYSSPLKRASETARPICDTTGLPLHIDERLCEIEIPGAEHIGLHELSEMAIARGGWSHLPGVEPSQAVRTRMTQAIDETTERHAGERVAVVSHAGAINAYIASLLGLAHDFFFPAGNTSISVVRARDERRLIVTLNDIAHLEALHGAAHAQH